MDWIIGIGLLVFLYFKGNSESVNQSRKEEVQFVILFVLIILVPYYLLKYFFGIGVGGYILILLLIPLGVFIYYLFKR